MKLINYFFYALIASGMMLTGCTETPVASTTYSGTTTQAAVNDVNSTAFAKAAIEATLMTRESKTLLDSLSASCVSGTATQDVNILDSTLIFTFNNCDLGSNQVLTGQATVSGNLSGNASISFINFTVKDNAGTTTSSIENMTASCTGGNTGTCTLASDFTGTDGLIYRISSFTVVKDVAADLTTIAGRLYHPSHGYVDITTTSAIGFGTCTSATLPDGGIINFTGSNNATITYTCTDITTSITGGATTVVNW